MNSVLSEINNSSANGTVKSKNINNTIKKYTLVATGLGLIPNPIAAVAATTGTQVFMVRELCKAYHLNFDLHKVETIINAVIGGVLTKAFSVFVSSVIPNNKPTSGPDFTGAAICGIYTATTVGEYYRTHFQKGGTLESADLKGLANFFMEEIERGDIGLNNFTNPASIVKRIVN